MSLKAHDKILNGLRQRCYLATASCLIVTIGATCSFQAWSYEDRLFIDDPELQDKSGLAKSNNYFSQTYQTGVRREQLLFSAQTSASIITGDEIIRSGARSVPEALRLLPGVLVMEIANGVYDVSIRGFNTTPPGATILGATNRNVLLMVDNRTVFDFSFGNTPWENLIIPLEEIDRIELLRGPASAKYGSQAYTGVIHIISKQPVVLSEVPWAVRAKAGGGDAQDSDFFLGADFNLGQSEWSGKVSYKKIAQDRLQSAFYSQTNNQYQSIDDVFDADLFHSDLIGEFDVINSFPDPDKALQQEGVTISFRHEDGIGREVDLNFGHQAIEITKPSYYGFGTPLSQYSTTANYVSFRYQSDEFYAHAYASESLVILEDQNFGNAIGDENKGTLWTLRLGNQWVVDDVHTIDLEHRYHGRRFSTNEERQEEVFTNGVSTQVDEFSFSSQAITLSDTWQMTPRLQSNLTLGLDWYDIVRDASFNQLIGLTYQLSESHLVRFQYSTAFQGAYGKQNRSRERFRAAPIFITTLEQFSEKETENIDSKTKAIEIGLRAGLSERTHYDFELWYQEEDDLSALRIDQEVFGLLFLRFEDVPTSVKQFGMTFSIGHHIAPRRYINTFFTLQKSKISDFYEEPLRGLTDEVIANADFEATPTWYGGFVLNWGFAQRINLNVNGYYLDERAINIAYYPTDELDSVMLLNGMITFDVDRNWRIYLSSRNTNDSNKREFAYTDVSQDLVLFGVEYSTEAFQ